jgi:PadR family transcriptional regulator, regulatory protein PadR
MENSHYKAEFVRGTLDMLILTSLRGGPLHGYAVARRIQQTSADFLRVEEGSLYPALHRLERRGWIEADWGLSEANRKAKYYRLTSAGKAQLQREVGAWQRFVAAIAGVLRAKPGEA